MLLPSSGAKFIPLTLTLKTDGSMPTSEISAKPKDKISNKGMLTGYEGVEWLVVVINRHNYKQTTFMAYGL
jgi:hypothetical protein